MRRGSVLAAWKLRLKKNSFAEHYKEFVLGVRIFRVVNTADSVTRAASVKQT